MDVSSSEWTVWGIAELWCWLGHFPDREPTGHDVEDCLQAHLDAGIDHVVWKLGRGAVDYRTSAPNVSRIGDACDITSLKPPTRKILEAVTSRCALRTAVAFARDHGMTLYGRLGMNRHYSPGAPYRSRFADEHPEYAELRKDGQPDTSRLCYVIPEYRQERIAIFREAAELGVDGVQLDFCRQPPALLYHPSLCEPFHRRTGVDPRTLTLQDEHYLEWCRFRADVLTGFLGELRVALRQTEEALKRRVPVQVRIPDDGFDANLIGGFDIKTWCVEGLVDGLMLSSLQWLDGYTEHSCAPYVALAHAHDIPVYAGSNCLPVQGAKWSCKVNPDAINPLVLAQRALRDIEAGADGLGLYQSDTGVDWPGLGEALHVLNEKKIIEDYATDPEVAARWPIDEESRDFGLDNHSTANGFRCDTVNDAKGV